MNRGAERFHAPFLPPSPSPPLLHPVQLGRDSIRRSAARCQRSERAASLQHAPCEPSPIAHRGSATPHVRHERALCELREGKLLKLPSLAEEQGRLSPCSGDQARAQLGKEGPERSTAQRGGSGGAVTTWVDPRAAAAVAAPWLLEHKKSREACGSGCCKRSTHRYGSGGAPREERRDRRLHSLGDDASGGRAS